MKLLNNNKEILEYTLRDRIKSLHYFLSHTNPFDNIANAFDIIFCLDDNVMYIKTGKSILIIFVE